MSQTPTTRRQLRERATPTEKDEGRRRSGVADKHEDTPGGASGVKIRTRLSTGTLIMNGTSTLKESDLRTPPSTPTNNAAKALKDGSVVKRRAATSGASSEPHPAGPPPKLRKIVGGDGQEEGDQNDYYCWVCHKEGGGVYCHLCPRTYHLKCLGSSSVPKEWVCMECENVMRAECTDTCSKAMVQITTDTLCLLLRYALDRMRQPGSEIFQKPVDSADIPNYSDYIFHLMDFTVLEKNIKKKEYGCTEGFLADAKWILHNCIIFNGLHHKLTTVARNVVKSCKHEMTEIEVCPQCYEHSCVHGDSNWFIEPCNPPHTLVWAKLKGYPFWPAKALQEVKGQVDVRFFGAHDMSWIPLSQVFLLSMEPPTGMKNKKGGFGTALDEMEEHIQLIREKYSSFEYAPYRTPYDRRHVYMNNKLKCVNMMAAKRFKASSYAKVGSRGKDAEKVSALAKTASALKSKYSTIANKKSVTGPSQGRNQHLLVRQSSSSCESSPEKVVGASNERTPCIMTARMRASKSLLLSPRVNVTDIIQEKIHKQKEQDKERTEEGWGETDSSSAVERDETGTFQKGCADSETGQSQNVNTEMAGDAGRTDINTVTNNPEGESNKQEEEAVLKENSVPAAKKIPVGCETETPVATSERNPDSDSVDSVDIVTENEFSNDGSSASSKDAKTSANSVKSFVEAEKVTAQTTETGAENVAGVEKLAADRVTGAEKVAAGAEATPPSTETTVREKNATGVRQVPVVEERSQGISASSERNSSCQASSSINAGATLEATSFQSKAGNSTATAAKDNTATISINSIATPVTPSASSVKSVSMGSVPKETVSGETVSADLSPKTGVEYKHSLLKTIEACKGKLGITGDGELAEPMEVSDNEEDSSDDNKGKKKEGGDGSTTTDCRASSEKDGENVTAVSDDGNNRERQTDSKDKHDDREDLTETTDISSRSAKVSTSSDSDTLSPASLTGDLDTASGVNQNKTHLSSKPNASRDGSDASLLPSKEGSRSHSDDKATGQQSASDHSSDISLLRQAYSSVKVVSMTPSRISDMARPVSAESVMSGSVSSKGSKLISLLSHPAASSTQSVSEPCNPVSEPSNPVSASSKPVSASSKPVTASSTPVSSSSKPVSASSKPVSASSKPDSASSKPVSASSKSVSASSKPVSVSPSTPVSAPSTVNTVNTGLFCAASPQDPAQKVSVVRTVCPKSSDPVSASGDAKARTSEETSRSGRAVSQAKPITIDDDDDKPGLLMEVESEGERDSLIIDLDEDDLDLNESGSKSKEKTQTFVRELAPSLAVIQNLQKASRLQANILRNRPPPIPSNNPFVTIPASVQKSSTDTSQSSSSVPSQASVSSPPCVMIDVRSLSGLEHEWNDDSVPTTAPPQTQSATKTSASPSAQLSRTPSQPPFVTLEFRVPPTPSTEQRRRTPPAASPSPAPTQGSAQRSGSSIGASEEDTVEAERTLTPAAISLVNKYGQQLVHNTQYQLAEMCREILAAAPDKREHERHLQEVKEHLQWTHEQQVAEIQHNFKMTIAEMKACWEAEKSKALNDLKKKLAKDKDEGVAAAKKKQWCAHCWKEAMYYCCWNTSYCTYDCQQSHWNSHKSICRQVIDAINAATIDATPTPDASLLTTAATVSLSEKRLSALEEEKLKAQKFNLPNPNIRQAISLQTDEAWRNRLPLPPQTLGMGHNIHFLPAQQHQQPQQPQQPASQPLQQLQYLHSLGATAPATFQTNSQVQLMTQRPAINTMLPTGAVMPGNTMVFPILRSSQPGSLPGTQNVVLNRPMHYPMWKHC